MAPFPVPPPLVRCAFDDLAAAHGLLNQLGDATNEAVRRALDAYGDLDSLPRPWDPATCPPALRVQLWAWLEDVAAWINHEYAWEPERALPACWPRHPHIVHDLALCATHRYSAALTLTPDRLEDWHRWSLPNLLDRARAQVRCQPGKHTTWPGRPRHDHHQSPPATAERAEAFTADTTRHLDLVR